MEEEKKIETESRDVMDIENEVEVAEAVPEKKNQKEFNMFLATVRDCNEFLKEALKPSTQGGYVVLVEYRGGIWQSMLKSQELLLDCYKKPNPTHALIKFMTNLPERSAKDSEVSLFQHLVEFMGDFCLNNQLKYEKIEEFFDNPNLMHKTLGGLNGITGLDSYLANEYYENTFYSLLMVMTYWALLLIQNAKQLEILYLQGSHYKQVTDYNLLYYLSTKSLFAVVQHIDQLLAEDNSEAVNLETFNGYFKNRVEMIQLIAKLEDYISKITGYSLRDSLIEYVIMIALFAKEYRVLALEKDQNSYEFIKENDANSMGNINFETDQYGQRVDRISWEPMDEIMKFALYQTINPSTKPSNCMFYHIRELLEYRFSDCTVLLSYIDRKILTYVKQRVAEVQTNAITQNSKKDRNSQFAKDHSKLLKWLGVVVLNTHSTQELLEEKKFTMLSLRTVLSELETLHS